MTSLRAKDSGMRSLTEANVWRVRLAEAGVETDPNFESWLTEDPAHAKAWADSAPAWEYVESSANAPEMLAARRDVLSRAALISRPSHLIGIARLAAATVVGLIVAAGIWAFKRPHIYSTDIGERRVITLADNSVLTLDAASKVSVRFSSEARRLELLQGQARFDVTHNPARPFIVRANGHAIVATGTSFDVALNGSDVQVVLIEGHVVVQSNRDSGRVSAVSVAYSNIKMSPGQKLVFTRNVPSRLGAANIQRDTAWESGQLVVDNETLASVISEMSRYSSRSLIVTDDSLGQMRMSGVFNTNDISGFVDTLMEYFPIQSTTEGGKIILRRRPSSP